MKCEYCNSGKKTGGSVGRNIRLKECAGNESFGYKVDVIIADDGTYGIVVFVNDSAVGYFDIHYCPMCGASLSRAEPLFLDRLKQMAVEPLKHWVWIEDIASPGKSAYFQNHSDFTEGEAFCCGYPGVWCYFKYTDYGKTWIAFDRKPEQQEG